MIQEKRFAFISRFTSIIFWSIILCLMLVMPSLIRQWYREKTLSILAWPSVFSAEFLKDFERQTGIKVRVTYFENNEELLVKMSSGASRGYDLIMPADYIVAALIKNKVLKKIDQTKLLFWHNIDTKLLHHHFDNRNDYTIPYAWSIYGIAFNNYVMPLKREQYSWRLIFDTASMKHMVGMIDDAREISSMAAWYLFKQKAHMLNDVQWQQLNQLLHKQKNHVAMYTDLRTDYLLFSGIAPVVLTTSSDIVRLAMHNSQQFLFFVPQEGTFWVIDSFAIPASTDKDDMIYAFLNYIYQPTILGTYVSRFGFSPAIPLKTLDAAHLLYPTLEEELARSLQFFDDLIPESRLNEMWISLKA